MSEWKKRKPIPLPIKIGIALTLALLCLIFYLGSIYRCVLLQSGILECRYNVEWLLDSSPNEIGDAIAGVFATLAFVWIVVTVFLQSAELSEQRAELALTREELRLAREAQEKQLEVMNIQARIFEDEKRQRHENRAKEQLDLILPWLAPRIAEFSNRAKLTYVGHDTDLRISPVFSMGNWVSKNITADDLPYLASEAEKFFKRLPPELIVGNQDEVEAFLTLSKQVKEDISLALDLREELSEAERFRVSISGIEQIEDMIIEVESRINYPSGEQS